MAQICADTLGVDYAHIRVIHGQTDRIERGVRRLCVARHGDDRRGDAARRGKPCAAKALKAAATLMQTPRRNNSTIVDGVIAPDAGPGPSMTLAEFARARPNDITADGFFEYKHMIYPYGVHIAQVKVDAETGGVTIERYLVAYDVGRAVNPMLIEGQIAGGVAQGIGGALYEEFLYDDAGEPLSVTFADYLMPTAREMPPRSTSSSARTRPRRSIRSASRAPAKAASTRSARPLPRRSTTRWECRVP